MKSLRFIVGLSISDTSTRDEETPYRVLTTDSPATKLQPLPPHLQRGTRAQLTLHVTAHDRITYRDTHRADEVAGSEGKGESTFVGTLRRDCGSCF